MNRTITAAIMLLFAITAAKAQDAKSNGSYGRYSVPSGCSVITVSKGDSVFFGGNDDYINPDSYYWVEPGDSSRFGVIWIGTPDNPQQGINEKNLAYDSNGLPRVEVNPHSERIPVDPGGYHKQCMQIMHECATVEQVIEWVGKHQRFPYMHDQMHFADSTGDAVIISAGKDGEVVFTRKEPGDGYLVSTNFNVANPANGFNYPCWRYDEANMLLGKLLEGNKPVTASDVTDVMEAVHMEDGASWTIETMVADLVKGKVLIYYFYQYDQPFVLDVREELLHPREPGALSKLFPEDVREEAARRYEKATAKLVMNRITGLSWPLIVLVSLIIIFFFPYESRKEYRLWIPAAIVFGPMAIVIKYLHSRISGKVLKMALVETLGNLMPVVLSYTSGTTLLIVKLMNGNNAWQTQLALVVGLPVAATFLVHVLLVFTCSRGGYLRLLLNRLPQVLIINFLGLAGYFSLAMPLLNKSLNMSLLIPLSPYAVITWLVIVVHVSLPAGILILLYEQWAVRKGFKAWTIFSGMEEESPVPPAGKLWWWLLISFAVLIAGLIAGILLSK